MRPRVLIFSGLLLTVLFPAQAQFILQGNRFPDSDPAGLPAFGSSVAVSADGVTALVGGPLDNSFTGAAWIFTRQATGFWTQQVPKLVGTGAVGPAEQGVSVAMSADGNTAVVGGPFDNTFTGAAWVFTRSNGTWTQQGGKLVGTGVVGIAGQGTSVAISSDGNTLALGGPVDNGNAGAVWIFTRTNGVWSQQGGKISGSGAVGAADFGSAVALSADGNTLVAGGPTDANNAGATWVFTRSVGVWIQQGSKLLGSGGVTAGQGSAVAVSSDGNTLITGGPGDSAGGAWVFVRSGSAWTQQGDKFVGQLPVGNVVALGTTHQGWVALSADGNTALVGAPVVGLSGNAFTFTRTGSVWTRQNVPVVTPGQVFVSNKASLGSAVAISADAKLLILGGPDDLYGAGSVFAYAPLPPPGVPSVVGVSPSAGSGNAQTFTFTFSDTLGATQLTIVNILINSALDGRQACYLAFEVTGSTSGRLDLVDNAGDASGPYSQIFLNGATNGGILQNAQCAVTGAGSTATSNGNTLTVTLAMSFSPSFAGNKVIYLAARQGDSNSGWQARGTWNVPGPATTGPGVGGVVPVSSTGPTQTYTFTFTDTNGWQDIGVANILVNSVLDGRHACYLAYVPTSATAGMLHLLVDNPVDAGGPFTNLVVPGAGSISNSQCTISGTGASVSGSGNTLTLTLPITFSHSFAGNLIFYLAARNNTLNSGWQTVGTVAVP